MLTECRNADRDGICYRTGGKLLAAVFKRPSRQNRFLADPKGRKENTMAPRAVFLSRNNTDRRTLVSFLLRDPNQKKTAPPRDKKFVSSMKNLGFGHKI